MGSCKEYNFITFNIFWEMVELKVNALGIMEFTVIFQDTPDDVVFLVITYDMIDFDRIKVEHIEVVIFLEGLVRQ